MAREAGVHPGQLYGWRRQLCARQQAASGFAAVRIVSDAASFGPATIDVEFADGARMRIVGAADPTTLTAAIAALAAKDRRR